MTGAARRPSASASTAACSRSRASAAGRATRRTSLRASRAATDVDARRVRARGAVRAATSTACARGRSAWSCARDALERLGAAAPPPAPRASTSSTPLADRGLPCWKPCPLVVTLHNSVRARALADALFPHARSARLWYWKHELVNARLADVVLTVSDTTRDGADLRSASCSRPTSLARVYLAPADGVHADPDAGDDAVRRACHGLARPYVLYVGGYDAQ